MQFIDIATELSTSVTDLVMALLSIAAILIIHSRRADFAIQQKAGIWIWAFLFLGLSGLFGFFAHGFQMDQSLRDILWQPLNLSLGLTIALFAAAVLLDLKQKPLKPATIGVLCSIALLFYFITFFFPETFLVFIAYEAVAMLFALVVYAWLSIHSSAARWMTLGIALSIIAAVIQAGESMTLRIIWLFDHNGIFHLVQMLGVLALLKGILSSTDTGSPYNSSATAEVTNA